MIKLLLMEDTPEGRQVSGVKLFPLIFLFIIIIFFIAGKIDNNRINHLRANVTNCQHISASEAKLCKLYGCRGNWHKTLVPYCKHKGAAIRMPNWFDSYAYKTCNDCQRKIPLTLEEIAIIKRK